MSSTIDLKKNQTRRKKNFAGKKEIIVIIVAIILTTLSIKASDKLFTPQEEEKDNSHCPADMVHVPLAGGDFCLDKYEASPGPECPYNNPVTQGQTRINLDYKECRPVSVDGRIPWRNISQDQAAIACAKAGKRLPTNKEWLAAALGTPDIDKDWGENDCQVNSNWNSQPGLTGSGKNCVSAAGAYDMVGNVWEWVNGTAKDGYFGGKKLPPAGYIDGTDGESFPAATNPDKPNPNYNEDYFWVKDNDYRGIARGGYWDNKSDAGQYAVYIVTPPSFAGVGTGFRCAK